MEKTKFLLFSATLLIISLLTTSCANQDTHDESIAPHRVDVTFIVNNTYYLVAHTPEGIAHIYRVKIDPNVDIPYVEMHTFQNRRTKKKVVDWNSSGSILYVKNAKQLKELALFQCK